MEVIRKLSDRVEKEHNQFLRDSQRLEDRSSAGTGTVTPQNFAGTVDFQTLVGNGAATSKPAENKTTSWDEDVWGSIFNDNVRRLIRIRVGCGMLTLADTGTTDCHDDFANRDVAAYITKTRILLC